MNFILFIMSLSSIRVTAFLSRARPILQRFPAKPSSHWRLMSSSPLIRVDIEGPKSVKLSWSNSSTEQSVYRVNCVSADGSAPGIMSMVSVPEIKLENLLHGSKYNYSVSKGSADGAFVDIVSGSFDLPANNTATNSTAKAGPAPMTDSQAMEHLGVLEIRVGRIVEVNAHPEADTLYVSKVDVGEPEPRTIVSGLVKYCSRDDLLNRRVIVLCNLKPRPLRGVMSQGMLLCASNPDHTVVKPLAPPEAAAVGELVRFTGAVGSPAPAGNKPNKAYEKVADRFFVNEAGVATFMGVPFSTEAGPCVSDIIGRIS